SIWRCSKCSWTEPKRPARARFRSAGSTSPRTSTRRSGWTSPSSCVPAIRRTWTRRRSTRTGRTESGEERGRGLPPSSRSLDQRNASAYLGNLAAEQAVDGGEQVVGRRHPQALDRDLRFGCAWKDDTERRGARAWELPEQRLQLRELFGSSLLRRELQLDPRRLRRPHVGEARHLVHLDLRRRLGGVLLLRFVAELLRHPHHAAHQHRLVAFEERFVPLGDVFVDHEIARAGQVFQHRKGDLLAGLRQPLAPALDDPGHRHLLESARGRERGAGMRGEPLHVLGVARQRMPGDVEAQGLLLQCQALALAPLLLAKDALLWRPVRRLRAAAEETELPRLTILLCRGTLL